MIPLSAVWAGPARDEHLEAPPLFFARDRGRDAVPLLPSCRRCRPHAGRRPDRRRQVGAAGADGAAVPPLSATPRSSPSTSAARSAPRRSRWAATGMISAARCRTMRRAPVALQPLAAHRRCRRARLGGGMDRRHPGARGRSPITPEVKEHLWSALTSLASAPVARAHADRPVGAAAIAGAEARAATLLRRRSLSAACSTPRPSGSATPTSRPSRPRA